MFEHRKYHWLWFLLGMMIAIILGTLMGCDRGTTDKGRDCIGFAGMSVTEVEQCEPVSCCAALIPECKACEAGMTEEEWIRDTCGENAIDAEYYGWNEELNEPIWLCQAAGIPEWMAE